MAAFINNDITTAGLIVLAKGVAGQKINYTKIVLGDGYLEEGQTPRTLTGVVSPKATVDITKLKINGDGTVAVGGIFTNGDETEGFYYRELGLYAEDPDPEVGEVLYCYGNCGDLAEWIPPSGGATIVEKTIDIVTAIGTATNVTAYIPADAYATKEDYETYKAIALGAQATAEEALALARQAIAIAQAAEASANDLSNAVGQNTSKIATLWDAVFSDITSNPFQITFADLTGITLKSGVWNTLLHSYCYETARRALKWLKDPELIDFAEWLLWLIIDSTPDPGIPIGNQSSQLLALLYLDAFDHWLRDDRGLVYGRYMDDFYIIHSDKLLLRQILKEIEAYIKPLGLRLNGKTQILPLKNGIDFLGFHTYLTQTGKVVRKVRAKSIDNMKRKIRKFRGLVDSGKMTLDSVVQSYASWTGHISHGNTYHLRQNMDAYFFSYFPELNPSPKGDTTHGPKTEQPRKQVEGQVRQPVRQPDRLDRGR